MCTFTIFLQCQSELVAVFFILRSLNSHSCRYFHEEFIHIFWIVLATPNELSSIDFNHASRNFILLQRDFRTSEVELSGTGTHHSNLSNQNLLFFCLIRYGCIYCCVYIFTWSHEEIFKTWSAQISTNVLFATRTRLNPKMISLIKIKCIPFFLCVNQERPTYRSTVSLIKNRMRFWFFHVYISKYTICL